MLAFGHAGITLGTVLVLQCASRKRPGTAAGEASSGFVARTTRFVNEIDLRVLLVGSLLPDIIDKPLGHIILRESIGYGRIYAHTLLFVVLLAAGGWLLYNSKRQKWCLTLAIASAGHLVLDVIWRTPTVLFWPFLGIAFPRENTPDYLAALIRDFLTQPDVFIGEIVGFLVALGFGIILLARKDRFRDFFLRGRI